MKKVGFYISFLFLFVTTGCKKYLEKEPDNRAQLNTPDKVSQLLASAYPQGNYMAFAESISDNVNDKGAGRIELHNRDPYFFEDTKDNQQDSPEYYWNASYRAISNANLALQAINKAPDSANYSAQKGEALVARAYAHFMLVNFFAKFYDAATAASDPGIPYVTEVENVVFKQYDRKTVAYVYDMIEKDLLEGMPLIRDEKYSVPRYHFNRAAANAFAARFYLFKKDYNKVIQYANGALPSSNVAAVLRPWNTTYRTMTYNELYAVYAKATEPANLLIAEAQSLWARNYYTVRYSLDATKQDSIFGSNVTGGTWAFQNQTYTAGTNNYLIPKINEYFVKASVNAEIGFPYVMVPLFTTEEVLFNRAEAYTYLNNTAAALTDLNTYASTRIVNYNQSTHAITASKISSYYNTANLQQGLIRTILDFKRAEYAQEGMRWFDVLRYKIPVTHIAVNPDRIMTLGPNDLRRVFQIPESAGVSGVAQNPR
ncbi:MAG: RagB/SusD family nutrient uptake outer membrane protein [Flavisolibacter sp.]|nr:RagB/SusD family nutrient uptake outer membrane protein [Flavisolibacter sp.]